MALLNMQGNPNATIHSNSETLSKFPPSHSELGGNPSGLCSLLPPHQAVKCLQRALQPMASGISLHWDLPPGLEVSMIRKTPEVIFQGHQSSIYAQIRGQAQVRVIQEPCALGQGFLEGKGATACFTFPALGVLHLCWTWEGPQSGLCEPSSFPQRHHCLCSNHGHLLP